MYIKMKIRIHFNCLKFYIHFNCLKFYKKNQFVVQAQFIGHVTYPANKGGGKNTLFLVVLFTMF